MGIVRRSGVATSLHDIGHGMGFYADPAFSTDGRVIGVGVDGQLLEFDATTGTCMHRRPVDGIVYSLDNVAHLDAWLAAGSMGLELHPRA